MITAQESVKVEKLDDYTIIRMEKWQRLDKIAKHIVTALASIANGQEKEVLLDISSIVRLTKIDEDLIKQIDKIALQLNISMSLVNPRDNVRTYIENSRLNETVPTYHNIEHYNSAREGKYYDV